MKTVTVLLLCVLSSAPPLWPQPPAPGGAVAQGETREGLDRLLVMLNLPGAEGREARERAVQQLFTMRDERAHEALRAVLARDEDPDQVMPLVLRTLSQRLRNPLDPVFFANGSTSASEAANRLRRAYGVALIQLYVTPEGPALPEARSAWLSTDAFERVAWLQDLLKGRDLAKRLAAVHAAGDCRSLNVAPLLAGLLHDDDLADATRAALRRLTFMADPFPDQAAFQTWFEANRERTYLELAEAAAREAQDRLDRLRAEEGSRRTELVMELVASLAGRQDVGWKRIQELTLVDEPRGLRQMTLRRLATVLSGQEKAMGSAADRINFLEALHRLLGTDLPGQDHAAILEVTAYVVDPGDKELHLLTRQRLLAALSASDVMVQVAALQGLRRHAGPETRKAVVALASSAQALSDQVLLGHALKTLQARGWTAPAPDVDGKDAWIATLRTILRDRSLPRTLREQAVQILALRDREQRVVPDAFRVLHDAVADANNEPEIRERAMIVLRAFTTDQTRYEEYLAQLLQGLADPSTRIRDKAAAMLLQLPEAPQQGKQANVANEIQVAASDRLLKEQDEAVLKAVVEVLRRSVDPAAGPAQVVARVSHAIEELEAQGVAPGEEFRRTLLVEALSALASNPSLQAGIWIRACGALARIRDRQALRYVLTRQKAASLTESNTVTTEDVTKAMGWIVRAALLKAPDEPFAAGGEDGEPGEAADVIQALQTLERLGRRIEEPEMLVLRLEAYAALSEHGKVVELGRTLLADARVGDERLRVRVTLAVGRALLARGQIAEARRLLESMPRGAVVDGALELYEQVGRALLAASQLKDAAVVLDQLRQLTPPSAPSFRERLLLAAETIGQVEPSRRAEIVDWLEARKEQFMVLDAHDPLRRRYESLLVRLRGGN